MPESPPPPPTVPVVGLTGAVAAGKSTVAALLAERGGRVIDVDGLGREVLDDVDVRDEVAAWLGGGVLHEDGSLDRAALASRVFDDEAALRRLEGIVHPRVRARLAARLPEARAAGSPFVVLDVALLFESGLERLCDVVVVVHAGAGMRRARAAAARGWSDEQTEARERRQLPAGEKRRRADHVILNDGTEAELAAAVDGLLRTLGMNTATNTPPRAASCASGQENDR